MGSRGSTAAREPCRLAAMGLINGLGGGADRVWQRLIAGDTSGIAPRDGYLPGRALLAAQVDEPLPAVGVEHYDCRNNALSLAALEQITRPVAEAIERHGASRVGVVMGTSTSGSAECEAAIRSHTLTGSLTESFRYPQLEFGATAGFIADHLGVRGPTFTLSTACSSSARSLAAARSLLRTGLCDAVVAGGSDSLCGLTACGFSSLQAVSNDSCNPMSANRSGLTLGEGAAIFLVTRDRGGIQLRGVGESSEAHHMSAPDPKGSGAIASMRGAIEDAGLAPEAIAYLNLHGTGTQLNDAMESRAVSEVLGSDVPCSSTKPLVGHTLGAAGAMELAFCWLALARTEGRALALPPHVWDGMRDPAMPAIRLVEKGERIAALPETGLMTNSFGFGGNNCTLVIASEDAAEGEGRVC